MSKNYVTCIIPARKSSKGIKNKNLQKINGKELIQYPFELAHKSKYVDEVIFSSDSQKYIKILEKLNKKKKKKTNSLFIKTKKFSKRQ